MNFSLYIQVKAPGTLYHGMKGVMLPETASRDFIQVELENGLVKEFPYDQLHNDKESE